MGLYLVKSNHHSKNFINEIRDPFSPWNDINFFRLNAPAEIKFEFLDENNDDQYHVLISLNSNKYTMDVYKNDEKIETVIIQGEIINEHIIEAEINENRVMAKMYFHLNQFHVFYHERRYQLTFKDNQFIENEQDTDNNLTAPMPGTIVKVSAKAGDRVKDGDVLLIMEAMKMEHTIVAPFKGVVDEVFYQSGEQVSEGDQLVTMIQDTADE